MHIGQHTIISPGAQIAPDVVIGDFCRIEPDVIIGPGTRIQNYVELRGRTIVGANCMIDSGVKSSGQCVIGDGVTLRYDTIIARGCVIGDGAYLCPRVMTNNLDHHREAIGGARVGARCFIGTHTVLAAGIAIADDTIVGAQAFVTKSITQAGVYIGTPARFVREL